MSTARHCIRLQVQITQIESHFTFPGGGGQKIAIQKYIGQTDALTEGTKDNVLKTIFVSGRLVQDFSQSPFQYVRVRHVQ